MGIGVNLHIVVPINKIIFQDGPVNKGGQQQQTEDDQAFAQITTHIMSASRYRRRHRQVTRQNRWLLRPCFGLCDEEVGARKRQSTGAVQDAVALPKRRRKGESSRSAHSASSLTRSSVLLIFKALGFQFVGLGFVQ